MLCSKCKKRNAIVFMSNKEDKNKSAEGLCYPCAKEMGLDPVHSLMNKMGIQEEELKEMENQLSGFMSEQLGIDTSELEKKMDLLKDSDLGDIFGDLMKNFGEPSDQDNIGDIKDDLEGVMKKVKKAIEREESKEENKEDSKELKENKEDSKELKEEIKKKLKKIKKEDTEKNIKENNKEDKKNTKKIELEFVDEENLFGDTAMLPAVKNLFSNILFPDKNEFIDNNKDSSDNSDGSKNKKKVKRKNLDLYCTNLTGKAKNNELDRIIGRDQEINRTIQILCRRTKNNPCLIGEPGVGKTAIAEGLAIKIHNGDVPYKLKNKEIFLLDLTALVAGTQFRGQFESRIKNLVEEVKKDGNIILFIDEVHTLVGAGDSEGSMSAANILKPALSRGEIQVIGATTFAEYRKHIEKDSALERRFQSVKIVEPSIEQTINILTGIKDYYENHHRVKISDNLIKTLVILSERYITDRFLPDKSIDLMDEACTYNALHNPDLVKYDKIAFEIDKLKQQEEQILSETETSNSEEENTKDYELLAKIRCNLAKNQEELDKIAPIALGKQVTISDISNVIELWTGIPSAKIQEREFGKIKTLEQKLKQKIIGQDTAIEEVSAAIRRNRVQIGPRRRPASFIFAGPTGVGKTELVKVLTDELFDTPDSLIRLDMSEYMEKHSSAKIIGTPPGYVGYDEAGQLTEKVRQRPYSVILLDEIEKAHPDVLNILLQVLDEGHITDSHGRKVNFENTVIIMTTNAGSNNNFNTVGFGKNSQELSKEKTLKSLREFLKPEFISRLDEIIVFNNLTKQDFVQISKLMLEEYVNSLSEHNINFSYNNSCLEILAEKSYGKKSGARDLRNLIRKEIEDKISLEIINNSNINSVFLTSENNNIKLIIK